MKKFYTFNELEKILKVGRQTIRLFLSRAEFLKLPHYRSSNHTYHIELSDSDIEKLNKLLKRKNKRE